MLSLLFQVLDSCDSYDQHIQNKSVLIKASINSKKQQEKGSLLNKIGAAIIGYSVGSMLDPPPHMPFAKILHLIKSEDEEEKITAIHLWSKGVPILKMHRTCTKW